LSANIAALVVACTPAQGEPASCRTYPKEIRFAINKQVGALRALEQETADRLKGLDTRTFEYLLAQARSAAEAIGNKDALAKEDRLEPCRDGAQSVRHMCAEAAQALVNLIEEQAAGAASRASKRTYAEVMPRCERGMNLVPLSTIFRTSD
jgi:hypothetical protein